MNFFQLRTLILPDLKRPRRFREVAADIRHNTRYEKKQPPEATPVTTTTDSPWNITLEHVILRWNKDMSSFVWTPLILYHYVSADFQEKTTVSLKAEERQPVHEVSKGNLSG